MNRTPLNPVSDRAVRSLALLVGTIVILSLPKTTVAQLPGSTVYYSLSGVGVRAMTPDGKPLGSVAPGVYGNPSRFLHGGYRWFLDVIWFEGEFYPNGETRNELVAVREDGALSIQLTNDPTLERRYTHEWTPSDDVSFWGRRWSGGAVLEGGIYHLPLVYDLGGNIAGSASIPSTPVIPKPLVLDSQGYLAPNMSYHSWSPDGQRLVYATLNPTELWIATLANNHVRIYSGRWANVPQWSPANTRIAFMSANSGISTINPDGTGVKEIVKRTPTVGFGEPKWSPDGSSLIYYGFSSWGGYQYDVYRCSSTGAGKKNLTNTNAPVSEYPLGWR